MKGCVSLRHVHGWPNMVTAVERQGDGGRMIATALTQPHKFPSKRFRKSGLQAAYCSLHEFMQPLRDKYAFLRTLRGTDNISWPRAIDPVQKGYKKRGVSLRSIIREQPHPRQHLRICYILGKYTYFVGHYHFSEYSIILLRKQFLQYLFCTGLSAYSDTG